MNSLAKRNDKLRVTAEHVKKLEEAIRLVEKLDRALPPEEQLHTMEEILEKFSDLADCFHDLFVIVLLEVNDRGVWRAERIMDSDGKSVQRYTRFEDWAVEFSQHFQKTSRRTINRYLAARSQLRSVGASANDMISAISRAPYITQEVMSLVNFDRGGKFTGIRPEIRQRMQDQLGIIADESKMSTEQLLEHDRELAKEFATLVLALPKGDARHVVNAIRQDVRVALIYDKETLTLKLVCPANKWRTHPKFVHVIEIPDEVKENPEAIKFLKEL